MLKSKTLCVKNAGGVCYLTFPKIEAAGGAVHGFSTRLGGASSGIYSTMSFSQSIGDEQAAVLENFKRFSAAIGAGDEKNTGIFRETDIIGGDMAYRHLPEQYRIQ